MPNTKFDDFIKQQKAHVASTSAFDPDARRMEWLDQIQALYHLVETYLDRYITAGDINLEYQPTEIIEDLLGLYRTQRMVLTIGSKQVVLEPVGAIVIGARGRADLKGASGQARLLLVDKRSTRVKVTVKNRSGKDVLPAPTPQPTEFAWKFATAPPSIEFIDLSSDTLMSAIMDVAGG